MNRKVLYWSAALALLVVLVGAFLIIQSGGARRFNESTSASSCVLPKWDENYYAGAKLVEGNGWEYYIMVFEANSPAQEPVGPVVFSRLVQEYNATVTRCSNGTLLYNVVIRKSNPSVHAYGVCSDRKCYVFVVATCDGLPPSVAAASKSCTKTSP